MSTVSSVNFQAAGSAKKVEKTQDYVNQKQTKEKKPMSTTAKVALAGLGIAGAIGMAMLAIKKGKAPKVTNVGNTVKEPVVEFLGQFKGKRVGKWFVDAKDNPFTGTLISSKKGRVELSYVNGKLMKSVIKDPCSERIIKEKIYKYNPVSSLLDSVIERTPEVIGKTYGDVAKINWKEVTHSVSNDKYFYSRLVQNKEKMLDILTKKVK